METLEAEGAEEKLPSQEPEFMLVEIMGHRRYGARVTEVQRFGATFLRAEVMSVPPFVQYVAPSSLFALTPCTEEQARKACSSWSAPEELRPERLIPARAMTHEDVHGWGEGIPAEDDEDDDLFHDADDEPNCPECGRDETEGCAELCTWAQRGAKNVQP